MRNLFVLPLAAGLWSCATQAPQPAEMSPAVAGAAERGDLLPDEQVQQVLNRLAFGGRPGDAERIRAMGVDRWIDQQLHPERIPDAATDSLMQRYQVFAMPTPDIIHDYNLVQQFQREAQKLDAADTTMNRAQARRELLAQSPQTAEMVRRTQQYVGEIQSAELARAVTTNRQLEEVMAQFWENHFSVFAGKGQTRLFLTEYDRDVIRPRALGKFRDLLGAVAKSPAMLFFLDNFQSAADSTHATLAQARGRGRARPIILANGVVPAGAQIPPALRARLQNATPEERQRILQQAQQRARPGLNENYARELMELHTLGVDGGYTQKDVQEVARALTGWTFNRQTGQFVFNPALHDADAKVVLGHKLAAGRGIEDGEEVLDIVAHHPSTARFIATKLARNFVSDDPPPALVDRCAQTFTRTDGDIRETVSCIVTSPEFFSRAAYRSKVKTPFQLVASALRAVDAQPDTTPRTAQIVARLGQPIFGRQTPDGWPDRGDAWMNTGAILNRINFGLSVAAGQVPGAQIRNSPELVALRDQPRAAQVDGVVKSILGGQVSSVTRDVLMTGQNPMLDKAAAMPPLDTMPAMMGRGRAGGPPGGGLGLGRGAPPPAPTRPINLLGLPQVVGLALGAPEFQRR